VAGSCEYGDEPSGSGASELVSCGQRISGATVPCSPPLPYLRLCTVLTLE
jgi:hypothetical protein